MLNTLKLPIAWKKIIYASSDAIRGRRRRPRGRENNRGPSRNPSPFWIRAPRDLRRPFSRTNHHYHAITAKIDFGVHFMPRGLMVYYFIRTGNGAERYARRYRLDCPRPTTARPPAQPVVVTRQVQMCTHYLAGGGTRDLTPPPRFAATLGQT